MKDWKDPSSLGFLLSLLLHGSFLFFVMVGFLWGPAPLEAPQLISVDIMTLGPQTLAPRPKPPPVESAPQSPEKKTPPPAPAAEPEESHQPLIDPQELSPKPILETPEKPKLSPDAVPLPQKKPKPQAQKKASQEKKKPSLPLPQKKSEKNPKKSSSQKTDGLDSLLKEVESEQKTLSTLDSLLDADPNSQSTAVAPGIGSLTISEKDFIRQRIGKFWSPPPATKRVGIIVVVSLEMEKDGRVRRVTIDSSKGTVQHPQYQIAAESILRALQNPEFTLPLPPEKHNQWEKVTLNVSPENF